MVSREVWTSLSHRRGARGGERSKHSLSRGIAEPSRRARQRLVRGMVSRQIRTPVPHGEARIQAEESNTAYREETPVEVTATGNAWYEGWYRAKFGRPSPLMEMRLKDQTR